MHVHSKSQKPENIGLFLSILDFQRILIFRVTGEIRKCSVLIRVMMGVGVETQTCVSTREGFLPRFIERHFRRIKHLQAVGSLGEGRSWELEESSCAQRGEAGGASLLLSVTLQSSGDSHRLTQTSSQYRLKNQRKSCF